MRQECGVAQGLTHLSQGPRMPLWLVMDSLGGTAEAEAQALLVAGVGGGGQARELLEALLCVRAAWPTTLQCLKRCPRCKQMRVSGGRLRQRPVRGWWCARQSQVGSNDEMWREREERAW